ncbi:MAG: guanylate kinase [Acetobacter sp.]|nr:guanylate kinase [Acetobacter sp.]
MMNKKQPWIIKPRRGVCLVISAPSGAGKSTIAQALQQSELHVKHSISVTTRPPRPGEKEGVHYYFRSVEQFQTMVKEGALLEWATVFKGSYGTPRAPVEAALQAGYDMIFDIDWQGHRQIRKALPADVVSVFVLPPSLKELERRLHGRGADHHEDIAHRMSVAQDEISHWKEFDYVIVNAELEYAIAETRAILHAARLTTTRQISGLRQFVTTLGVS